jgi:hypothetical protein
VRPGEILLVQATSASNHAARVKKALALPALQDWLQAGGAFAVWNWRKTRGEWQCRRQPVTLAEVREKPGGAAAAPPGTP